jgi:hypothetical protein
MTAILFSGLPKFSRSVKEEKVLAPGMSAEESSSTKGTRNFS